MGTYVMSDLHGCYVEYKKMLELIEFSDNDMLYIIGDILDRGPEPIKIVLDLMKRTNVEIIAGNHCYMALSCLDFLLQEITDESIEGLSDENFEKLMNWNYNGGGTTIRDLSRYDTDTKREITEFISDFELYDEIEVNGKSYILVHAGFRNFRPDKPLWEYDLSDLVWQRTDYGKAYFKDKYVITGHTPTQLIKENDRPGYIYQGNNHIAIDCGCVFENGRLGCIRLEDMKEFYVEM